LKKIIVAAAAGLMLAGCATNPQTQDRGGQDGNPPDQVLDVDYVEVYRNADTLPNIMRTCVQGLGFASSTSSRGESAGGTPMLRVPEWDTFCATKVGGPAPQPEPED
jgi:hypothetical protein